MALPEVQRLLLFVEPWNVDSQRAAQACSYRREGLLPRWKRVWDGYQDMHVYSVIQAETDTQDPIRAATTLESTPASVVRPATPSAGSLQTIGGWSP